MVNPKFLFLLSIVIPFTLLVIGGCELRKDSGPEKNSNAKPYEEYFLQKAYPEKTFPLSGYLEAMESSRRQVRLRTTPPEGFSDPWNSVHPVNFSGRINTIALHPENESIIYAGLASGGVFKTTDGGINWLPVFDQQAYLSIGSIALDPSNPEVVYVGTGDPNVTGFPFIGDGLYRSSNGGNTWQYLGLKETRIISSVIVDPTDSLTIWVACQGLPLERTPDRGVYKTSDGGKTWKKVLYLNTQAGITDMVLDPFNPKVLYAAFWDRIRNNRESIISGPNARIYRSEDSGETWKVLSTGLPASNNLGRIALAISKVTPGRIFARYVGADQELENIYRSDDSGKTWAPVIDWKTTNIGRTGALGGSSFGWFFGRMAVHPGNDFELYLLGVDLWRTRDGGKNWELAAPSWRNYDVHADKHDLVFGKSGTLFLGTDGGLFSKKPAENSWSRVGALPGLQFFRVGFNPHKPDLYYGGAQDNGTVFGERGGKPWRRLYANDGFAMQFSPTNPKVVYVQMQYGKKFVSLDDGENWLNGSKGVLDSERTNWDCPFIYSSHQVNVLYTGTYRVYKSDLSEIPQWYAVSPDLTDGNVYGSAFHTISTISESPRDPKLLYAGTTDGNVWRSSAGGGVWTPVNAGLPDRYVTSVHASPNFTDHVFASFSGYKNNEFLPHIFRSKNRGASWENISGDLPPIAVNDLMIMPGYQDSILFAATDAGVYGTINGGLNWYRVGNNLPLVASYDLAFHIEKHELLVGSFGRSIYSYSLETLIPRNAVSTQNRAGQVANISVFPVPTRGTVTLRAENVPFENAQILLVDQSGRVLLKKPFDLKNSQEQIDLSRFPPGVYILSLQWPGGGSSRSVIKL